MLKNIKVSIIVPIYNVERYLIRCIDALVNQTYRNIEIILVDDGSPDNCGSICEDYAKQDNRIRVIHKKNAGLGMARNSGLDIATGDYVVFIDSDDYVKINYIELLLKAIIENDADLALSGFIRKIDNKKEIHNPVTEELVVVEKERIVADILLPVIGAEPKQTEDVEREMCVWRNMYKRELIEALELRFVSEREYVSEDIFFNMLYFINTKRAVLIPECIYYYSDNGGSLTNTYRQDRYEKYCKMLLKQIDILKENNLYDIAKLRLFRTFIMKTKKSIGSISCSCIGMIRKVKECHAILNSEILQGVIDDYFDKVQTKKQKVELILLKKKKVLLLISYYWMKGSRRQKIKHRK